MPVRITVKNTKVSDRTKERIEKAGEKLRQYYDRIIDCEMVVEKSARGHAVELKVHVPQRTLVATSQTEHEENLFKCIDEAYDRMEVQLKKLHDKMVEHR
jgi:ribosomal subunit interface protein